MKMIDCLAFKTLNRLAYEDILWAGISIHILSIGDEGH